MKELEGDLHRGMEQHLVALGSVGSHLTCLLESTQQHVTSATENVQSLASGVQSHIKALESQQEVSSAGELSSKTVQYCHSLAWHFELKWFG